MVGAEKIVLWNPDLSVINVTIRALETWWRFCGDSPDVCDISCHFEMVLTTVLLPLRRDNIHFLIELGSPFLQILWCIFLSLEVIFLFSQVMILILCCAGSAHSILLLTWYPRQLCWKTEWEPGPAWLTLTPWKLTNLWVASGVALLAPVKGTYDNTCITFVTCSILAN